MKLSTLMPLLSLSLVACTTTTEPAGTQTGARPSKQASARALVAATSGLSAAQATALANRSSLAGPAVVDLDFAGPCELGGQFTISGTYDYTLDSADSEFDLDTHFTACGGPDGALDGNLRWQQTLLVGEHQESITGQLTWQGVDGAASCAFDVSIVFDADGIHYSGMACGWDISADLATELEDVDPALYRRGGSHAGVRVRRARLDRGLTVSTRLRLGDHNKHGAVARTYL